MNARPDPSPDNAAALARRHLRLGWWALLVFLCLGAVLESLHGFKVQLYLAVTSETRRLLWTLAHAHGTLLALVNISFALSLPSLTGLTAAARSLASRLLCAATVLLPAGFFLGGAVVHEGDPGLGVLLVPPAALFLLVAVLLIARAS